MGEKMNSHSAVRRSGALSIVLRSVNPFWSGAGRNGSTNKFPRGENGYLRRTDGSRTLEVSITVGTGATVCYADRLPEGKTMLILSSLP